MKSAKNRKAETYKEFVAEAEEILDGLDRFVLELDSSQDKSQVKPEVINALFRGAHTIKGISGMAGLNQISKLSHALEEMLDRLRLGKMGLGPEVIATLMEGVGYLREMVQSVQNRQGKQIDPHPVITKISALVDERPQPAGQGPLWQRGFPEDLIKVLTEYETHRLEENIRKGRRILEVKSHFALESFDRDLSNLMSEAQKLGEVLTTLPSSGLDPEKGIDFNIILGTEHGPDALKTRLGGDRVTIRQIGLNPVTRGPAAENAEREPAASVKSMSQSIRVDISRLDSLLNVVGELVLGKAVITQICRESLQTQGLSGGWAEIFKAAQELDRRVSELQDGLIDIRMVPVGQIFERLTVVVRKLCRELGKEVDLIISGEETRLDKSMVEAVADPLLHLIRNALDHGIEPREERERHGKPENGAIHIGAVQRGNSVMIELSDDGRGIDLEKVRRTAMERGLAEKGKAYSDQELIKFLFMPGFSTASRVSEVSGRGVGLDVVSKNISQLNGLVEVESMPGKGTKFSITLPITLVIIKALIIRVGAQQYAIPLNGVSESLIIASGDIRTVEEREVIQLRKNTLPLLRLADLFSLNSDPGGNEDLYVIVVGLAEKRVGLVVDAIEGQQEIVIRSMGETLRGVPGVAGATELGNRKTILVLDVGALIDEATHGKFRNDP